jgi:hypothetical protein
VEPAQTSHPCYAWEEKHSGCRHILEGRSGSRPDERSEVKAEAMARRLNGMID